MILKLLKQTASISDCIKLKVGAVIVNDDDIILCTGYNTALCKEKCNSHFKNKNLEEKQLFHSKWSDDYEIHAEAMAICECAKKGISVNNAILFVTHSPCRECAKLIIQSGIKKVFYLYKYKNGEGLKLLEENNIMSEQFSESNKLNLSYVKFI